jgi:hypothetical protein
MFKKAVRMDQEVGYDRTVRMYDEGYPPTELDRLMSKGNIHKGKFLNERFHYSHYLQLKVIYNLNVDKVLEIGPGESFVADYLRSLGITYDTLDSAPETNPTILKDLRDWDPELSGTVGEYDMVAAFQILEHTPYCEFSANINKLASATNKYLFVSLPYHCFGFRIKLFFSFGQMKRFVYNFSFHLPTLFKNRKYRKQYMEEFPFAVHYWEIGRRPFYKSKIEKIFKSSGLKIISSFHSENPYHYFYLLEK